MQRCFTQRDLPRLHFADKSFSFALNYPKYFPKAPGSASKSFYRQMIEAQCAEGENGENGRYEGQSRERNEQQTVKEGDPMQCHDRVKVSAPTFRNSHAYFIWKQWLVTLRARCWACFSPCGQAQRSHPLLHQCKQAVQTPEPGCLPWYLN